MSLFETSHTISELWEKRYRQKAPKNLPDNAVLRQALSHYSVRSYRSEPLPEGVIEAGIAAASSGASSSNLQSWSVVAVRDPETRRQLSELSGGQPYVAQAPLFLAWIVDLSRLERISQREGHTSEALDYEESFLMATLDTGIASQNAVMAFESCGLGTVYIGGLRNKPEKVAELLKLPPRSIAVVGLCVGYSSKEAEGSIKPRLSQEVVFHREFYDHASEEKHVEIYNENDSAYQNEQGLSVQRWTHKVVKRVSKSNGLGGRHIMRKILNKLGFPLQ